MVTVVARHSQVKKIFMVIGVFYPALINYQVIQNNIFPIVGVETLCQLTLLSDNTFTVIVKIGCIS